MIDHALLMIWYALLVSVFFAFLWREDAPARKKFFLKTFLILVLGGIALGWLMYPFP